MGYWVFTSKHKRDEEKTKLEEMGYKPEVTEKDGFYYLSWKIEIDSDKLHKHIEQSKAKYYKEKEEAKKKAKAIK